MTEALEAGVDRLLIGARQHVGVGGDHALAAPARVEAAVFALVERLGEPKLATLDRRHFSLLRPRNRDTIDLLPV
jgi:hypothetical protein